MNPNRHKITRQSAGVKRTRWGGGPGELGESSSRRRSRSGRGGRGAGLFERPTVAAAVAAAVVAAVVVDVTGGSYRLSSSPPSPSFSPCLHSDLLSRLESEARRWSVLRSSSPSSLMFRSRSTVATPVATAGAAAAAAAAAERGRLLWLRELLKKSSRGTYVSGGEEAEMRCSARVSLRREKKNQRKEKEGQVDSCDLSLPPSLCFPPSASSRVPLPHSECSI